MTNEEKIKQLREIIYRQLSPLIDRDYVYLDLPYYNNIGDSLIWAGTKAFLKQFPYKCLYSTNFVNYDESRMNNTSLILLQGGGNFGDLYSCFNDFRKDVIRIHPTQRVIILPQTVYYRDERNLQADADFYKHYPNVTICARDQVSYTFLKQHFTVNQILLVPDMAFCIPDTGFHTNDAAVKPNLYLKRVDKEYQDCKYIFPDKVEIHDWPTFEYDPLCYKINRYVQIINGKLDHILKMHLKPMMDDWIWKNLLLPYNVKTGIKFLSCYNKVYTTRLHVAILSILLHKDSVYLLDNSYGKLRSFYQTWLRDVSSVKYIVEK